MKKITQENLRQYRALENDIDALSKELAFLKDDLITRLTKGANVEDGERTAKAIEIERRTVSWKQIVIRLKNTEYVKRVLAATKPTFFVKLTVR